ncbi:GIY-YIG nuclease family protein [Candidatus Saganbacteria bacterium]|nr:GIY-YIG nuclease family protein [Candidatus Saganbacteria bacterium]
MNIEKKYYVYVLQSLKDHNYYVGQTADVNSRLSKHNKGAVISTRSRRPLILLYVEEYFSRCEAMRREKYFKSPQGGTELKATLKFRRGVEQPG